MSVLAGRPRGPAGQAISTGAQIGRCPKFKPLLHPFSPGASLDLGAGDDNCADAVVTNGD